MEYVVRISSKFTTLKIRLYFFSQNSLRGFFCGLASRRRPATQEPVSTRHQKKKRCVLTQNRDVCNGLFIAQENKWLSYRVSTASCRRRYASLLEDGVVIVCATASLCSDINYGQRPSLGNISCAVEPPIPGRPLSA